MLIHTPAGLDEIIDTFGNLDTPNFGLEYIKMFTLPYPLFYAGKEVKLARCHWLLVENFQAAFEAIKAEGFESKVKNYSGIYANRAIRGQSKHPSTHCWGIAIDVEAEEYPLGSTKRFPEEVVEIWERAGFFYGGDFKSRKDPMHFQFARYY